MSGLYSRNKGKRNEYLLRDYFTGLGYTSHRVPMSGAATVIKGDVTVDVNGTRLTAELKVRQNEFKSIYALFDTYSIDRKPFIVSDGVSCALLCAEFNDMGFTESVPVDRIIQSYELDKRTVKKLMNLEKLVKDCDFLVIKIDRKPFLFIRYWDNLGGTGG